MGTKKFIIFVIWSDDQNTIKTYMAVSKPNSQSEDAIDVLVEEVTGELIGRKTIDANTYAETSEPWIQEKIERIKSNEVPYVIANFSDTIIAIEEIIREIPEDETDCEVRVFPISSIETVLKQQLTSSDAKLLQHYEYLRELHEDGFPFPADLELQARAIEAELESRDIGFEHIDWDNSKDDE